eukprot:COSAG02_NODE_11456_length_1720_cov_13.374460_1_plen_300_part_10
MCVKVRETGDGRMKVLFEDGDVQEIPKDWMTQLSTAVVEEETAIRPLIRQVRKQQRIAGGADALIDSGKDIFEASYHDRRRQKSEERLMCVKVRETGDGRMKVLFEDGDVQEIPKDWMTQLENVDSTNESTRVEGSGSHRLTPRLSHQGSNSPDLLLVDSHASAMVCIWGVSGRVPAPVTLVQALYRLALAYALHSRLSSASLLSGMKPEFLWRIGQCLIEKAIEQCGSEHAEFRQRAQQDLDRVNPDLEAAHSAIETIETLDMTALVRGLLKQPHQVLIPVVEAVCVLYGDIQVVAWL